MAAHGSQVCKTDCFSTQSDIRIGDVLHGRDFNCNRQDIPKLNGQFSFSLHDLI